MRKVRVNNWVLLGFPEKRLLSRKKTVVLFQHCVISRDVRTSLNHRLKKKIKLPYTTGETWLPYAPCFNNDPIFIK